MVVRRVDFGRRKAGQMDYAPKAIAASGKMMPAGCASRPELIPQNTMDKPLIITSGSPGVRLASSVYPLDCFVPKHTQFSSGHNSASAHGDRMHGFYCKHRTCCPARFVFKLALLMDQSATRFESDIEDIETYGQAVTNFSIFDRLVDRGTHHKAAA